MLSFFEFLKARGEPITGWSVWAVLAYFQYKRTELLTLYDIRVAKQAKLAEKFAAKPIEKSHFTNFMYSFKKFIRITGLKNVSDADITMLDLEAKDWESIYQRKRKQADEIPIWVLEEWENLISDPEAEMTERIFAWSFRVAVAAGLRWGDLLNSSPNTLILTTGGLTGFAAKTKARGVSEGRPWGGK